MSYINYTKKIALVDKFIGVDAVSLDVKNIHDNQPTHILEGYSVTDKADGESMLFSVGTYKDLITFSNDAPLFKEKIVVVDTFGIARLLSTPI